MSSLLAECLPPAYLLTAATTAEKGISHAYILMILMPDTTSFMMRILWSASIAVLLLGGSVHRWINEFATKELEKLLAPGVSRVILFSFSRENATVSLDEAT